MDLFDRSFEMVSELIIELNDSVYMDGGLRLDLVYSCCDLSIEHSQSVRILLENELYTSALALMRVQAESVARAYWMLLVARNDQILKFQFNEIKDLFSNENMPMFAELITSLKNIEQIPHIVEMLEDFKLFYMKQLNSIIHSGKHSLLSKVLGLTIQQVENLVKLTNAFTIMAAQILLRHSAKENFILYINNKYSDCFVMYGQISESERESYMKLYK